MAQNSKLPLNMPAETGGFHTLVGYEFEQTSQGKWITTLEVDERHLNQYGVAHGGVSLTLLDVAGGVALYSNVSDVTIERMATISLSQNFVTSMKAGRVTAVGEVERRGNAVGYCTMKIFQGDENGALVASGHGAYRLFLKRD